MLQSALQLCKEIAPNMNLGAACQKFVASQYYHAVIDLCATCARKIDLENIAEHYYKSNEPNEDHEGYQFYVRRYGFFRRTLDDFFFTVVSLEWRYIERSSRCWSSCVVKTS